jgi:hypothetical protein
MWSHQVTGSFCIWFLLSTGHIAIGKWAKSSSSCRVVRAVVFHQMAAALPFSCSSVWSDPPSQARWGNSVLNAALCPTRSAPGSTTCPTLGDWLVAPPLLSTFGFSQHLLGAISSSGRFVCCPTPALSLHASPELCSVLVSSLGGWNFAPPPFSAFVAFPVFHWVQHWEFSSLPQPHSPG